ncbi:Ig-like domain-containing protein, partial [Lactiplantibacillus plantarum]|nr:Ig-like domain-containing protein [Lactiplantibacillus plantarum]
QVNGTWMTLDKAGAYIESYNPVDSAGLLSTSSSLTVTIKAGYTGSLLFQAVQGFSWDLLNWVTVYTFASNLAEVDVYSSNIPATNISIAGDDYVINPTNSSSGSNDKVTSQFTSTTNPENATGTITWTTSDSSIATIDDSGLLTVVSNGTVTITATITNADGTSYSSSKTITIGSGLEDTTADAGSDLTWVPDGSTTGTGTN